MVGEPVLVEQLVLVDEYFSAEELALAEEAVLVAECIELPGVPCTEIDMDKALEACDDTQIGASEDEEVEPYAEDTILGEDERRPYIEDKPSDDEDAGASAGKAHIPWDSVVTDACEDEKQTEAVEKGASSEDGGRLAGEQVLSEHVGQLAELERLAMLEVLEVVQQSVSTGLYKTTE